MDKWLVIFVIALFTIGALGQVPVTPSGGSSSTTTSPPETIPECMARCPSTPEYNPICGTNLVTYDNPGRLECAKLCGVRVSFLRKSRCENPLP